MSADLKADPVILLLFFFSLPLSLCRSRTRIYFLHFCLDVNLLLRLRLHRRHGRVFA